MGSVSIIYSHGPSSRNGGTVLQGPDWHGAVGIQAVGIPSSYPAPRRRALTWKPLAIVDRFDRV
eukprot:1194744-Prorocentrum_minimum.AAC.3